MLKQENFELYESFPSTSATKKKISLNWNINWKHFRISVCGLLFFSYNHNNLMLLESYSATSHYLNWLKFTVAYMIPGLIKLVIYHICIYTIDALYPQLLWHLWAQCWLTYIDGLAQDCGNSSAAALELPQSCAKPSKSDFKGFHPTLRLLYSQSGCCSSCLVFWWC